MHIGWLLDRDAVWKYAKSHGAEVFNYEEDGPVPSIFAAARKAIPSMAKDAGIPDDDRIDVVLLCDGECVANPGEPKYFNLHLVLTCGTNYSRTISRADAAQLEAVVKNFIVPEAGLKWYLDPDRWQWTRRPVTKKRKS